MVWFHCDDCGEDLKKPKLANHFRICYASRLSCIDCGLVFGQDTVQGHTQCITETEKYGPKGHGNFSNGKTTPKTKQQQQQPDFDIIVGLSNRPPWFCSLCNSKATSKQTLLLHADGKKHRAKARAIHAAKRQQSKQTEVSAVVENPANGELHDDKSVEEQRVQDTPTTLANSENDNGMSLSNKKRKVDESGMIQEEKSKSEGKETQLKKAKLNGLKDSEVVNSGSTKEDTNKKIRLKKLIKSALRTNPDGFLKMKKLKKLVLKSLQESGITLDETQLNDMLEQKVNASSKFRVDNKYVQLVAKD